MIRIIEFGASWCPGCVQQEPITKEFCEEYGIELDLVSVDESNDLAIQYGITSLPSLVILADGAQPEIVRGFTPKQKLKEIVENIKV